MHGTLVTLLQALLLIPLAAGGQPQSGRVEGWTVLPDHTALPGVEVTLACPPLAVRKTTSDGAGRFSFTLLPQADCRLIGRKEGYVEATFNGAPARGGYGIAVRPGATRDGIELELAAGAVITGAIKDEQGQPFSGGFIHVVRREVRAGVPVLTAQSPYLRLNPQGTFVMPPLPPGEYYVGVRPEPGPGGHAFTYFPGAASIAKASAVRLQPGARQQLDFAILAASTFTVSGVVLDAAGAPLADLEVGVAADDLGPPFTRATARTAADGTFAIRGMEDGSYVIRAARARPDGRVERGELHFDVTGAEVRNLTVRTSLR